MARRRTRYTVHIADRDPVVILAYSPANARDYYEQRGHTVTRVATGDYRREAHKAALVAAQGTNGWTLNRAALHDAIAFLGIKMPVQIKQTSPVGGQYGCHRFVPARGKFFRNAARDTASGGMVHAITVKSWLSPEQAGRTLWHELCHAMQSEQACEAAGATTERECFMAWSTCNARGRGVNYSRKPIEIEACEYEAFNDEKPLAR